MSEPTMREPDGLSAEVWEHIARVYQSDEKLAGIATKYGLTVQKIVARAKREGWPLRYEKTLAQRQKTKPGSTDPATLRKRLTALVERQIAEIEGRLADVPEGRDQERDARTLANLTRTLDKLIELKRAAALERAEAKRKKEAAQVDEGEKDADALRNDLARRLARLSAPASASAVSGKLGTS